MIDLTALKVCPPKVLAEVLKASDSTTLARRREDSVDKEIARPNGASRNAAEIVVALIAAAPG